VDRTLDQPSVALIVLVAVIFLYMGYRLGGLLAEARMKHRLPQIRREAAEQSRAVLGGQFSEQLAPYLPGFPYAPTEVRFLGRPVDFVVFKGLDSQEPTEIVFVEVKSGGAQLSTVERKLRTLVEEGRVRWEEYRAPRSLTGGPGFERQRT
jgi:predicted Holliday junction resolvase-like endonuclease